jgi:hypothetical protein
MIRPATYNDPFYRHSSRSRLGDTATQTVAAGSQIAGGSLAVASGLASSGVITLGASLAAAIPIAGAVIAIGTVIFSLLHNSRGLQQDAETTAAVNKAATYMQQNLNAWNASNKNLATQAAALQNFDNAWQAVVNFCGQASEGSPGQRCISERTRGGKYDFYSYYRDPIANDAQAGAIDRQLAAQQATAALTSTPTAGPDPVNTRMLVAIGAGVVLLAVLA